MTAPCVYPGCDQAGVVDATVAGPDGDVITGLLCFPHWAPVESPAPVDMFLDERAHWPAASAPAPVAPTFDEVSFSVEVTAGLAAMLLEHAAMALRDDEGAITEAVRTLAGNTGWTDDVATGVLLALTYVAAHPTVDADYLLEGAATYERMAEDDTPAGVEDQGDDVEDQGDDVDANGWPVENGEPFVQAVAQVVHDVAAILLDQTARAVDVEDSVDGCTCGWAPAEACDVHHGAADAGKARDDD